MKYLFGLTLVAGVALLTLGQTPSASSAMAGCTLTRDQAPEIRGIRLGMSTDQLQSVFPEEHNRRIINESVIASQRADSYGMARIELRPVKAIPNPKLEGVNYISVWFIDQRVTSFHIEYIGTEWKTVDQFVAKLTDGLRLPNASWEPGSFSSVLNCDGFKVEAMTYHGTTQSIVRVLDTSAPQVVEDRRETAREKARQAFKP